MKRSAYKTLGAAAALSMLGMGLVVTPVFAETVVPPTAPEGDVTLHLTKLASNASDTKTPGTGLEIKDTTIDSHLRLAGVKFKACPIQFKGTDINLAVNDGWAQVTQLRAALKKLGGAAENNPTAAQIAGVENYTVSTTCAEGTSGNDGVVNFGGTMSKTLYYVTELPGGPYKAYAKGDTDTVKGEKTVTPIAPFMVTLPTVNQDGTGWNNDVWVYPKNSTTSLKKTVEDYKVDNNNITAAGIEGATATKQVTYTLTGTVPVTAGRTLNYYMFTDTLPVGMEVDPDSIKVTIKGTNETGFAYNVADKTLKVWLTKTGLKNAQAAGNGAEVVVTFNAKITSDQNQGVYQNGNPTPGQPGYTKLVTGDGPLDEVPDVPGKQTPPNEPENPTPVTPEKPVETKLGKITLTKINGNDEQPLADVEFQLYRCSDQAKTKLGTYTSAKVTGQIVIEGLQYSNFKNGKDVSEYTAQNPEYCLQETKARAGFELLPEPIKFNVTSYDGNTAFGLTDNKVPNLPQNGGFKLPVTGANGLILLSVAGGLLITGGVAFAVARRRREEA